MIIYTAFLFCIFILSFGINVGKKDSSEILTVIASFLLFLPLMGRIFGWW